MTQNVVEQYNLCSKNVEQHFGKNTKFLLPAQLGPGQPIVTTLVDVSSFLTSLRMMKQWDLGSQKFGELIKKQKLDEKIFCTDVTNEEAPTPQTIATTISDLKTTLGTDPTYFKSQAGVHTAKEADEENDIVDIPEELIGDDLSPEQSQSIHDAINRAFAAATSPEVAVKLSGKVFRSQRLRSKQAFDKDSKTQTCSRAGCTNRRGCYN